MLYNVVITSAQPTFSRTLDTEDYPISAKIEVSVQTLFSATTDRLDEILGVTQDADDHYRLKGNSKL